MKKDYFESKVDRAIKKYLPKFLSYGSTELVFDEPEYGKSDSKKEKGTPDFAIYYKNKIFLLIEASKNIKGRLVPKSGSKHKDMRRYSRNYLSILVTNSRLKKVMRYFPPLKPLGYPHYYIMSITLLRQFFQFLERNVKKGLATYFDYDLSSDLSRSNVDEIIDCFIDEITPIEQKCGLCKNRLLRVGIFYCPYFGKYMLEMYADEIEYGREPYIFWKKSFYEFEDCALDNECEHLKRQIAQQCRSCGAVYYEGKILKLTDFDYSHADNLSEDFDFYKKLQKSL